MRRWIFGLCVVCALSAHVQAATFHGYGSAGAGVTKAPRTQYSAGGIGGEYMGTAQPGSRAVAPPSAPSGWGYVGRPTSPIFQPPVSRTYIVQQRVPDWVIQMWISNQQAIKRDVAIPATPTPSPTMMPIPTVTPIPAVSATPFPTVTPSPARTLTDEDIEYALRAYQKKAWFVGAFSGFSVGGIVAVGVGLFFWRKNYDQNI